MANPNISQVITTTLVRYAPTIQDAISNNIALLSFMKDKGHINVRAGGTSIYRHHEYALNASAGSYSAYDFINTTPQDVLTSAEYDWKQYAGSVVVSGLDIKVKNANKEQMHDLLKALIKNLKRAMEDQIEQGLYSDGTGNSSKDIDGLLAQVADLPTTGTVGGINRATSGNEYWRNEYYDISSNSTTFDASTARTHMTLMFNSLTRNKEKPTAIFAGDTYYNAYENSLQAIERIGDPKTGNSGFENLLFKGKPVVLAGGKGGHISDTRMYFLNFEYLYFDVARNANFTPDKDRMPTNQDCVIVPVFFAGNLTSSNLGMQGVICA